MRTLIINSMFASSVYRRCADELGALPGIDLSMLTVKEWKLNGRPMPFDDLAVGSPYRAIVGHAHWRGKENRGFYLSGLARAFQTSQPQVLFLMEEPFSIFAAQILGAKAVFAPHIPVVFFTWTNLSLEKYDYRPSVFYRNIARRTLPRMQYALTANSDGISVLRDFGFHNPAKVVGYGVDTSTYSTAHPENVRAIRVQLGIAPDDILIGYVGRLLEMKGVDLLIDAFASIIKQFPRARLLLIGSGEAELQLLSRIKSVGISEYVRHIPAVAPNAIPDYMHAIDILVLPSRRLHMWAEQFGRVLVEAMAAGKIVIGSSSGAIPEVIGDAGFVFTENDSDDLVAKLSEALTISPADRADLLSRARARAQYFSWPRFASDAFEAISHCYTRYREHA